MASDNKAKWYTKSVWIIVLLFLFFPVGLFLMWKYSKWNKWVKWGITIFFGLCLLGSLNSPKTTTEISSSNKAPTPTVTANKETKPTPTTSTNQPTEKPVATSAPIKQVATPTPAPVASETVSQRNALAKAESYLGYTAFSHDGLVDQLEYEQFSHDDAVYGADNCGANWDDQAAKKAKSYMSYSAFSRGSLIDQLIYDKFTQEQAEYGATSVGL
jgi:hypothetical protein